MAGAARVYILETPRLPSHGFAENRIIQNLTIHFG
jgi:hypothetical protein